MSAIEAKNVRIILKNDTAANWAVSTLILKKGEIAIETDTNKFKFGDGIHTFSEIEKYGGTLVASSSTNGNILIDGVETVVYTLPTASATDKGGIKTAALVEGVAPVGSVQVDANGVASVGVTHEAEQLTSSRTISVTGDVTGSTTFNGSADATINVALDVQSDVDVTKTYVAVRANSKGIIVSGDTDITLAKISDAGTAAAKDFGTAAGNVPVLDVNGKLDESVIPSVALVDTEVVADKAAMLALTTVQKGDIAIVTGEGKTYVLAGTDPSVESNWKQILTPAAPVQTVNGKTGNVILGTDDVAEGSTNLYYTDARVEAKVETMNSTDLADGDTVLHNTDEIIFDGGNASGANS